MFRIVAIIMAILLTIAFPILAIVTVPAIFIYCDHIVRRVKNLKRQREVFVDYMVERERHKALRAFR